MKMIDVAQGSNEWHAARLGIPTASGFHRLVTPTGRPSSQLQGYVNELVAEVLTLEEKPKVETWQMLRGRELEEHARAWYEFHTDIEVTEVGLVLRDDGEVGCSPDGLTEHGGLEIKCPSADKHVGFLLQDGVPPEYVPQVQGCLWLCDRDRWDFVSFHPALPEKLVEVGRDEKLIKLLESQVATLIELKMAALDKLLPDVA